VQVNSIKKLQEHLIWLLDIMAVIRELHSKGLSQYEIADYLKEHGYQNSKGDVSWQQYYVSRLMRANSL
jgi:hypothetical protein